LAPPVRPAGGGATSTPRFTNQISHPISATEATPAKIQGALLRERAPGVAPPAVARPQRWQNFAPGAREAPHPAQAVGPSGAPQLEQNFPLAGARQLGQEVVSIGKGKIGGPAVRR